MMFFKSIFCLDYYNSCRFGIISFLFQVWASESFAQSTIDLDCFLYLKELIVVAIAVIFSTSWHKNSK